MLEKFAFQKFAFEKLFLLGPANLETRRKKFEIEKKNWKNVKIFKNMSKIKEINLISRKLKKKSIGMMQSNTLTNVCNI